MSSYNYKYLQIPGENSINTDKNWSDKSFWQSSLWAEILGKTHQARDIILCSGESGEILLERRTIIGKFTGLYALGVDGNNINKELLEYIKAEIRQDNDLFLQIEPITPFLKGDTAIAGGGFIGKNHGINPQSRLWRDSSFKKELPAPFRRFIEPVTAILDLKMEEEKLFASFAEKGRYNIRLAQKRGITTRWVKASEACSTKCEMEKETEICPLDKGGVGGINRKEKTYLEAFYELLTETTERDGFSGNSLSYYQHFVETLEAHDAGGLLVAEKDGILHAAGIFVFPSLPSPIGEGSGERLQGGTAIYYYGASSSDRDIRRDMATYLLQWEAIREGMKRGCSTYDFLGISEDGKGKLAGVTEFKLRFNPEKVHLPSEIVVVYRPMLLKLLQVISRVRKLFR